jgi:cytochrome c oxidase cbb3-type subunit III
MRFIYVSLVVTLAACGGDSEAAQAPQSQPATTPGDSARFVAHPEHIQAGFPLRVAPLELRDPRNGDATSVELGRKLFVSYNCIDCHGAEGSGAMGPSLADGRWHFGGTPSAVYESIHQGRPDGMPSWGGRISEEQIWALVAYVRSLSAGKDVATENFTGKTVERSGH